MNYTPEQYLLDSLRDEYKETYPNIILKLTNKIQELESANNWISVDDELPENVDVVNVKYGSGLFGYGFYNKETSEWYYDTEDDLTMEHVAHWQPLPPPPEEK